MRVLRSIPELATLPGPISLGIGVFDGIHPGHERVIRRALDDAAKHGGTAVIVTFDPHPAKILRPEKAPHLLTSTPHKLQLIKALGVDVVLLIEFNRAFAATDPEVFIRDLARAARPLLTICVGEKWFFGKDRRGNVGLLREMGEKLGFTVSAVPAVEIGGRVVSSTLIRGEVEHGRLDEAQRFLGRPFTILGTVVEGKKLGHQLGFPTANLSAHNEQFPPNGVYAVRAWLDGKELHGVVNIGIRPSIEDAAPQRTLELHIFDFDRDIYGQDLEVKFEKFLRPEKKFPSLDALRAQIAADVKLSRDIFGI